MLSKQTLEEELKKSALDEALSRIPRSIRGSAARSTIKEAAGQTAKGLAKGIGSAGAAGVAGAAIDPIANRIMSKYESSVGLSRPDPRSTAGRLRSLTVGGGPLAAPYEVGKAATELTTEIIPQAIQLAYERMIDSPARENRLRKKIKERERARTPEVKNLPKIKKGNK